MGKKKHKGKPYNISRKKLKHLLKMLPEPSSGALYSPSTDRMRGTFADEIKKCAHGVPTGKVCAICDPEGFRLEYGYD